MAGSSEELPREKSGPMRKQRGLLVKLSLALGSMLFLLTSLELGSYLFGSFPGPSQPLQGSNIGRYEQYDYELFWSLRPFATSPIGTRWINSDGMREPELGSKEPEDYRILNLGESSTFGFGVQYQQTYSVLLGKLLDAELPERSIHSINAGVPGYSTLQGVQYLLRRSEKFAPDMVTLYFGYNDYLKVSYLSGRDGSRGQGAELGLSDWELFKQRSGIMNRLAAFTAEHSNFFRGMLRVLQPDGGTQTRTDKKRVRVPREDRLPLLTLARDFCRERNIELVIIVPIYKEFDLHASVLRANAAALDLPIVDLPAVLPSHFVKPRADYFRDPVHPGPEGHRLIADAIAELLVDRIR